MSVQVTYVAHVRGRVLVFADVAVQVGMELVGGREEVKAHGHQLPTMLEAFPEDKDNWSNIEL